MELCRFYKDYVKISFEAKEELYRLFPNDISGGNMMYIDMLLRADRNGTLNTTIEEIMKNWGRTRRRVNECMKKFKHYGYLDYVVGCKKNKETPISITLYKAKPKGAANG